MKKQVNVLALILALAVLFSFASAAQAPISEQPPDLQGQGATHLWTVPGVVTIGNATVFACTNVSTSSIIVGVEVFDADGTAVNDPSSSSLAVDAGGTVMFGTSAALNAFFVDSELFVPAIVTKGSARILATAKSGIICSAFLVADGATSPSISLSVVKKTTQQGD